MVQPDRPHITIWRTRIACWIPKATNTLRQCNTHCFSTATMIVRTRLIVTFICTLPDFSVTVSAYNINGDVGANVLIIRSHKEFNDDASSSKFI